jgi:hypothetical protein
MYKYKLTIKNIMPAIMMKWNAKLVEMDVSFGSEKRRCERCRYDSPKRSAAPPLPLIQHAATKILETLPFLATMPSKKKGYRRLDTDLRYAPGNELY